MREMKGRMDSIMARPLWCEQKVCRYTPLTHVLLHMRLDYSFAHSL